MYFHAKTATFFGIQSTACRYLDMVASRCVYIFVTEQSLTLHYILTNIVLHVINSVFQFKNSTITSLM